jgi:hypothetical protein
MQNTTRTWVTGIWLPVLVLLSAVPLFAQKKPSGEVINAEAFGKVRSYCIDTSKLAHNAAEAYDAHMFIKAQSGPKELLSKLPWKFFSDCRETHPDARIKVSFKQHLDACSAVLEVTDAASDAVFYRVEALPVYDGPDRNIAFEPQPFSLQRRSVLYTAFGVLISDVQRMSQSQTK